MYELKKTGKAFTSKSVGTGPSSYEKRIYRAAVSQRLRNTDLYSTVGLQLTSIFPTHLATSAPICVHFTALHSQSSNRRCQSAGLRMSLKDSLKSRYFVATPCDGITDALRSCLATAREGSLLPLLRRACAHYLRVR